MVEFDEWSLTLNPSPKERGLGMVGIRFRITIGWYVCGLRLVEHASTPESFRDRVTSG